MCVLVCSSTNAMQEGDKLYLLKSDMTNYYLMIDDDNPRLAVATGWGATAKEDISSELQRVTISVVSNTICQTWGTINK